MSYIAEYLKALESFDDVKNRANKVKDIRTGLVALFAAKGEGTVREMAKACGVSAGKVGRDQITGEWLAAHPKADAFLVKTACDILNATTIRACNSLADLQAAVKAMKAGKVAPTVTDDAPEDSTDDAPVDTQTVTKVTTPNSQMAGLTPGMLKTAKNLHDGKEFDADTARAFGAALVTLSQEWNAYIIAMKAKVA
jgi:hypothetical protein